MTDNLDCKFQDSSKLMQNNAIKTSTKKKVTYYPFFCWQPNPIPPAA